MSGTVFQYEIIVRVVIIIYNSMKNIMTESLIVVL